MKFSDNFCKLSLSTLAVIFLILYIYNLTFTDTSKSTYVIFGLSCALFAYRFSNHFKSKNAIELLVNKQGEQLEIASFNGFPFSTSRSIKNIDIHRISKVTVGKDWLSIIIDGNGNGYDFQLLGSQAQIVKHLNLIIPEQHISNIEFHYI